MLGKATLPGGQGAEQNLLEGELKWAKYIHKCKKTPDKTGNLFQLYKIVLNIYGRLTMGLLCQGRG